MRFITKEVETPLAKLIIQGKIMPNSIVDVQLSDGQLKFEATPNE